MSLVMWLICTNLTILTLSTLCFEIFICSTYLEKEKPIKKEVLSSMYLQEFFIFVKMVKKWFIVSKVNSIIETKNKASTPLPTWFAHHKGKKYVHVIHCYYSSTNSPYTGVFSNINQDLDGANDGFICYANRDFNPKTYEWRDQSQTDITAQIQTTSDPLWIDVFRLELILETIDD
jgi:hypothetical protein